MDLTGLRNSVDTYLNLIVARLTPVIGPKGYGLFINNHDGEFVFDFSPLVSEIAITASTEEETNTRNAIVFSSGSHTYYHLPSGTQYSWDGAAWSSVPFVIEDVFQEGRFYFSPYTHCVFYYTIYGELTPVTGV